MKSSTTPAAFVFKFLVGALMTWSATAEPVGLFDHHTDIGAPKNAGSAGYNAATQEYTLTGSGVNMWSTRDEFHFAYKKLKGDFILQARIEFVGKGADPHRKMGWMIRESLDHDSPYADAAVHGDGLTSLQFRLAKGAVTAQSTLSVSNVDVIQLERKGSNYIFSAARFGNPLVATSTNVALPDEVFVGIYLCSHNSNVVEKALFRNVRIIKPAKEAFVPYRDYIGSHLEILEVATGNREIIYSAAQPFEAPNWTPDGAALIYNTSGNRPELRGRLYRFDLATRKPVQINTDNINRLNNDHVLSFDGKQIGISSNLTNPATQSTIFTLPVTGGTPKRITFTAPSYLHSWSPDAKTLIFTGGRVIPPSTTNKFDIYSIPAEGGSETRLTDSLGLNDGPEYTPDGQYIYFNSTRTGTMQIWRMMPDGKNQTQITNDEYNNWFPHISRDGQWIAFISFPKEVSPEDHPYYKRVYIRLMPIGGGTPKVLAYVYGGQGTINVPSWSPDGKKLAFVSNTEME